MSKYTTGEVAKLCGVSVRTVQFYDTKGIVTPTELSEGGRRLYSDEDLQKMKVVCFLRELGLPLGKIGLLLSAENSAETVLLLLEQQETLLREELQAQQEKLNRMSALLRELRRTGDLTVETIGDIAKIMEGKKKLRRFRVWFVSVGLIAEALVIAAIVLWAKAGIWWPFVPAVCIEIAVAVWLSIRYARNVDYICPHCHEVFHPSFREMFWANHTPNTRKLTCPKCGVKSFCVETWGGK